MTNSSRMLCTGDAPASSHREAGTAVSSSRRAFEVRRDTSIHSSPIDVKRAFTIVDRLNWPASPSFQDPLLRLDDGSGWCSRVFMQLTGEEHDSGSAGAVCGAPLIGRVTGFPCLASSSCGMPLPIGKSCLLVSEERKRFPFRGKTCSCAVSHLGRCRELVRVLSRSSCA